MIKNLIFLLIKIIFLRVNLSFELPKKKIDLIIFDKTSIIDLEPLISKYSIFILESRLENFKTVYINLKIIKKFITHFKGNIATAYYCSLIENLNPNLVITFIDNSYKFHDLTKIFYKKIKFLAIQNAVRYEIRFNKNYEKKNVSPVNRNSRHFYDEFLTFGKYEIAEYKKNKIFINNAEPVGSLRLSNAMDYLKTKKIKKRYDICIISDAIIVGANKKIALSDLEQSVIKSIKFLIKIIKRNKLKFIFCFKRDHKADFESEMNFYKCYLSKNELNFIIKNSFIKLNKKNLKFPSYEKMLQSEVTVALWSSMLRENISLGRKSLSIDFLNSPISNFPIKGICTIKKPSFIELERRILKIISIKNKKYLSLIKNSNYVINDYKSTKNRIYKKIDKLI